MSLTNLIKDFEKGKKLTKASSLKKVDKQAQNLQVMLQKAKGLLVKEKLKDLAGGMETIRDLREYTAEMTQMGILPPEVIGAIMKQEVENQKNITDFLMGDKKSEDDRSPMNVNQLTINNNQQDNRQVNNTVSSTGGASRESLELVQKLYLYEEHIKAEIEKLEPPKEKGTVEIIDK